MEVTHHLNTVIPDSPACWMIICRLAIKVINNNSSNSHRNCNSNENKSLCATYRWLVCFSLFLTLFSSPISISAWSCMLCRFVSINPMWMTFILKLEWWKRARQNNEIFIENIYLPAFLRQWTGRLVLLQAASVMGWVNNPVERDKRDDDEKEKHNAHYRSNKTIHCFECSKIN